MGFKDKPPDHLSAPWVLFVAGQPTDLYSESLLSQAQSLTSMAKACCLIDERYREAWRDLRSRFWQSNIFSGGGGHRTIDALRNVLGTLAERDPRGSAIIIPVNHCAVDASTWFASTQGAVRLGAAHPNTVYMLHDKPENDPRVALEKPEICSSSVMVGSVSSLLDLCRGIRPTAIVDLVVKELAGVDSDPTNCGQSNGPINVVHVGSVDEYAHLQRAEHLRLTMPVVDVRA